MKNSVLLVCEGQYFEGERAVSETYLAHLSQDKQPAVWVSGFYGSGKSSTSCGCWSMSGAT